MKRTNILWAALVAVILNACGGTNERYTSKNLMGDKWNLKGVESGTFKIESDLCCLIFEADNGQKYAVNGTAKSNTSYPDFEELFIPDSSGRIENTLFGEGALLLKNCP